MERIIANLEKVKLKLDEAFFYLDEIEELIQEDSISQEAGAKVSAAGERLAGELSSLSSRVVELQEILEVLKAQEAGTADDGCGCAEPEAPAEGDA
jgi:hypothetical protein